MTLYTEAHFKGLPEPSALVPDGLVEDGIRAYSVMERIIKERWMAKNPGQAIGAALVFACHEGTPDPSLFLTEIEQSDNFPPVPQSSVRFFGTH